MTMEKNDCNSNILTCDPNNNDDHSCILNGHTLPEKLLKEKEAEMSDDSITLKKSSRLLYLVNANPPWSVTVLYAIQQILTMISGPVTAAFIIRRIMCSAGDQEFLSQLISTNLFMSGICTIIQVTIGVRLPIIQGSSFSYIPVLVSMMSSEAWKCPTIDEYGSNGTLIVHGINNTVQVLTYSDIWKPRMLEASGSMVVASVFQICLGSFGLIGFMMKFIGPLTISSTVVLMGLSITDSVVSTCKNQWGIALGTSSVIIGVLSFLRNVEVPIPGYSRARGCHTNRYNVFRLFPQAIAIMFGWSLCAILTTADVFPNDPKINGYLARTDINLGWISQSPWFFVPYPGMWGWPTFSVGIMFGMLAATLSSTIESVGDYYATASACEAPQPPKHAMNRGITMEGFGSIFCGLFGAAHATTSYSGVIGYISLTGMSSRRTWIVAGVFLTCAGIFGKVSAVLSTIPEPVIGGLMSVGICMVIGVGISTLRRVDLSSGRNLLVLGMSILLGTVVPYWIRITPRAIQTGYETADQIFTTMLSTSMLVGGLIAFFLDNIIPGTRAERGFNDNPDDSDESTTLTSEIYNLPLGHLCASLTDESTTIGRLLSYVPLLPCYADRMIPRLGCGCRKSEDFSDLEDSDKCDSNAKEELTRLHNLDETKN